MALALARDYTAPPGVSLAPIVNGHHPLSLDMCTKQGSRSMNTTQLRVVSDELDPLSMFRAQTESVQAAVIPITSVSPLRPIQTPGIDKHWNSFLSKVKQSFTTSEELNVQTLSSAENGEKTKGSLTIDSSLHSLFTVAKSQKDFETMVEGFASDMRALWAKDDRVGTLKVAINAANLLAHPENVGRFYPAKFSIVMNVLGLLEEFVYGRVLGKAGAADEANTTSRNWMLKISCVRELIPRVYIELSVAQCNRFMTDRDSDAELTRLCQSIRGIGDPVASMYARGFLCTQARKMNSIGIVDQILEDALLVLERFIDGIEPLDACKVHVSDMSEFLLVISPALEWILIQFVEGCNERNLLDVMEWFKNHGRHPEILELLLTTFPDEFISLHAIAFIELIGDTGSPRLFKHMGAAMTAHSPPHDHHLLLNRVWKSVTKMKNVPDYLGVASAFIGFVAKWFSSTKELDVLSKDVVKHAKRDNAYTNSQSKLTELLELMVALGPEIPKLLQMEHFPPLLDLITDRVEKRRVCKSILQRFQRDSFEQFDNQVLIHALLDVSTSLHDSVDFLCSEHELRHAENLVYYFVTLVDFGSELEQEFSFLTECRASFPNFARITTLLIHRVNSISMRALLLMKGSHNSKTKDFVKATVAFTQITIVAMDDVLDEMFLLLASGEVALHNGLVSQGESLIKSAVGKILDLTECDVPRFNMWLGKLAGLLVVFPGHPDYGPFYLPHGLLKALDSFKPWQSRPLLHFNGLMPLVWMFATLSQDKLPYAIPGIDSNDTLFGTTPEYRSECHELLQGLLETLVGLRKTMSGATSLHTTGVQLLYTISRCIALNKKVATLLVKLGRDGVDKSEDLAAYCKFISGRDSEWGPLISEKLSPSHN